MANLNCSKSFKAQKDNYLARDQEYSDLFDKLEKRISDYPKTGHPDNFIIEGRAIECCKQSIMLKLYDDKKMQMIITKQLSITYVYNGTNICLLDCFVS